MVMIGYQPAVINALRTFEGKGKAPTAKLRKRIAVDLAGIEEERARLVRLLAAGESRRAERARQVQRYAGRKPK
jgi:hypothetical protein